MHSPLKKQWRQNQRKDDVIEQPDDQFKLRSGDTITLQGLADHIEQAESRLFSG